MTIPPFELPDEVQNRLIQLAYDADNAYWEIGDICVELEDELADYYEAGIIRNKISECTRWQPETLRDIEWMCRKIPKHKRTYELSRHQYKACLGAGDLWEQYAARAALGVNGKPVPVEVIREWVKNGDTNGDWRKWWGKITKAAYKISDDGETPELVLEIVSQIIEADELGLIE